MSLVRLRKDELVAAAIYYGVEVSDSDTKTDIIERMGKEGVTWEMYSNDFPAEVPTSEGNDETEASADTPTDPESSGDSEDKMLLKMTRGNRTFQVRGATFTRRNPYALVAVSDAEFILDKYQGFRQATPSEVKEYYG